MFFILTTAQMTACYLKGVLQLASLQLNMKNVAKD